MSAMPLLELRDVGRTFSAGIFSRPWLAEGRHLLVGGDAPFGP